jgi:hypothetical protein
VNVFFLTLCCLCLFEEGLFPLALFLSSRLGYLQPSSQIHWVMLHACERPSAIPAAHFNPVVWSTDWGCLSSPLHP